MKRVEISFGNVRYIIQYYINIKLVNMKISLIFSAYIVVFFCLAECADHFSNKTDKLHYSHDQSLNSTSGLRLQQVQNKKNVDSKQRSSESLSTTVATVSETSSENSTEVLATRFLVRPIIIEKPEKQCPEGQTLGNEGECKEKFVGVFK